MLALPPSLDTHARLLEELQDLAALEQASPPDGAAGAPADDDGLRVVAWNAERGRFPDGAAAMLGAAGAQVHLLSELDWGMARTGQRHTARDLAERLGCGYVYGVEFLELGLGDARERGALAGQTNAVGFHGAAILSPRPLERPRLVRLARDGRWFDGALGERRVGGRMALLASVDLASGPVALATVHLESHSEPDERATQLAVLLDAVEDYAPGGPAVIGGDMNTSSLGPEHRDAERLRDAFRADPDRLRNPIPHEPLFRLLDERGWEWRSCNRLDQGTQRMVEPGPASDGRGVLHLDWLFCRGLEARDPEVIAAVDPVSGRALSDHEAVGAVVSVSPARADA